MQKQQPHDFGPTLKRLREHSFLTQEKLAEYAKISVESLRGYESGNHYPRYNAHQRLLRALRDKNPPRNQLQGKALDELEAAYRRKRSESPQPHELEPNLGSDNLTVGGLNVDWVVIAHNRYRIGQIITHYRDEESPLPADLGALRQRFKDWHGARKERGEPTAYWDGPTYKLRAFDVHQTPLQRGKETPVIELWFEPTTFFTQLVTDLDYYQDPARASYASRTDLFVAPVPEFASILGINLNILTADNKLIVCERAKQVLAGGTLHTSVAEHLLPSEDAGAGGKPDMFAAAVRGVREELGLVIDPAQVEYTAFGVYPATCQYSLVGWARVTETSAEVEAKRARGIPPSKAENRRLIFCEHSLPAVADFLARNPKPRWFSIGLAAVILSLYQVSRYSDEDIASVFAERFG